MAYPDHISHLVEIYYAGHALFAGWSHGLAANLAIGQAFYTTYDTIEVSSSRLVELMIAPNLDSIGYADSAFVREEGGRITNEPVRVSPVMKAELTGVDFDIRPSGSAVQPIENNEMTRWVWVVKPLSEGRKHLILTISIVKDEHGRESMKTESVLRRRIQVIARPDVASQVPFYSFKRAESDSSAQSRPSSVSDPMNTDPAARRMSATLIVGASFAGALVLFLMIAYYKPPNSPFAYIILKFITALCGALAGGLVTGEALVKLSGGATGGFQYTISGAAGFALFIIIWFFFPKLPPHK